jgi:hypothetical protein
LEAYKLYLESFSANNNLIIEFVNTLSACIEKLDKLKSSSFMDFKSIFSKSSGEQKEKNTWLANINSIKNLKFTNDIIANENCVLFSKIMKNLDINLKTAECSEILRSIIINNSDLLNDFTNIDEESSFKIFYLDANRNKISNLFTDQVKILYFKNEFKENRITEEDFNLFMNIGIYNQDSFDAYCYAQSQYDCFDSIVDISLCKNDKEYFKIVEKI